METKKQNPLFFRIVLYPFTLTKYMSPKTKKIAFWVLFPFWWFFCISWLGTIITIICVASAGGFLASYFITYDGVRIMNLCGDKSKSFGTGIGIFSIMCAPFISTPIFHFHSRMHVYSNWKYVSNF